MLVVKISTMSEKNVPSKGTGQKRYPSQVRSRSRRARLARIKVNKRKENQSVANAIIDDFGSAQDQDQMVCDSIIEGVSLEKRNLEINTNICDDPQPSTSGLHLGNKNIKKQLFRESKLSTAGESTPVKKQKIIVEPTELEDLEKLWDPKGEFESIQQHQFYYEKDIESPLQFQNIISGNRIVELGYVLNWAVRLQYEHSKSCTTGMLYPSRETNRGLGLVSYIEFKCTMCDIELVKATEDPNYKKSTINTGAVWGNLAIGSTYTHLEELLSCMNIPCFNKHIFAKEEKELMELWHAQLYKEMMQAGLEEREEAICQNNVDPDGVPCITVYLDGGWSKRSYGHNYNAASGVAVIIGKHTGKLLFLGVRNKYCTICARATNKDEEPKEHKCYRNWSGSSSAMEQDVIVEGFCLSEEQHGVRYNRFVADGDSSVWANIRNKVSYGNFVEKIECANHAIKNFGKALHKIKQDKAVSATARQQLTKELIGKLQTMAQSAIYSCTFEENPVGALERDLTAGIDHVFGYHKDCMRHYCDFVGEADDTILSNIQTSGLYHHVKCSLDGLLRKSTRLVDNETNNRAELFMSILARFNGGKRLHLTGRGSFEMRSSMTGLRYNRGLAWHSSPYKKHLLMSPGKYMKQFIKKSVRNAEVRCSKDGQKERKKKSNLPKIKNVHYGKFAQQVEPSDDEIAKIKDRTLKELSVTHSKREEIAHSTIGQFDNDFYKVQRTDRLTASNFGKIIHRRDSTRCHVLVKDILYPTNVATAGTIYGKTRGVAIRRLEAKYNVVVENSGLYIDLNHPYLAASPDGLIGDTHCVEVKTLPKLVKDNLTLLEGTQQGKTFLKMENGQMVLNKGHHFYCQIQGQLNIVPRDKCYLVVYVSDDEDIFVQEIEKDETYWNNVMLPKLTRFYNDCILEEIVRRRYLRGEKCHDPLWIEEAIQKSSKKKKYV